ncbi:MAG: hypothetical protein ABI744_00070 [Chloroflexota bacterium]
MQVRCEAVRYFRDPQPGLVEAYLTDVEGFRWQLVDKTVMFEPVIDGSTTLPTDVWVNCRAVSEDESTVHVALPGMSDRIHVVSRNLISN